MHKINLAAIAEVEHRSPKGKYHSFYKGVSLALGRDDDSRDLDKRHPFDLEYNRLPPGGINYPFHFHSVQWELYVVVSGKGIVRDDHGRTEVGPGDSFIFRHCEAHQLLNEGTEDFVYYVIADNPLGECCYYPDSKKWAVACETSACKRVRDSGPSVNYYEGEE
jgi:uncharacterized cupin superfamily protein